MIDSEKLTDRQLMELVQSGRTSMFEVIVRRYQTALLQVARGRLGRDDWAEDVVQDALLSAFKSRHTYNPQYSFRTWLWTILINQSRSERRRRGRDRSVAWSDVASQVESPESEQTGPLEAVMAKERAEVLEGLLGRLDDNQADAIRLRFFGHLKFQEIADTVGCSLATAKNRVRAGLTQLSAWIESESEISGQEHPRGLR